MLPDRSSRIQRPRTSFIALAAACLVGTFGLASSAMAAAPTAGQLVISEFRLDGQNSATSEYIEFTNTTATPIDIGGLAIDYLPPAAAPVNLGAFSTKTLPAHGTYLLATNNYTATLGGLAPLDPGAYGVDIPANSGIRVRNGGTLAGNTNIIDALVFSTSGTAAGRTAFRGSAASAATPITAFASSTQADEYAVMRKYVSGKPQDTDVDSNDFQVVGTTSPVGGLAVPFGAPGPQSSASPIVQPQSAVTVTLADPSKAQQASPNRTYDPATGVLRIRRTVTNNTGAPIAANALRFRLTKMTSLNSGPTFADLRLVTSTAQTGFPATSLTALQTGTPGYAGTTGGINSYVTLPTALAAGASTTFQLQFTVGSLSLTRNTFTVAFIPEL